MACLVALALLASCKKNVEPTISAVAGTNYASQNTEVFAGDQVTVGFNATGENLTKIEMNATQNGTVIYTHAESISNESTYSYTHAFVVEGIGTITISGTITDAKGQTATASFDIICNEKPNAKFIGHYEGNALISGSYDVEITGMEPMHEDFTDQPFATVVDVVAGDNMNEVSATVTINEQTNTVKGTVEGNKVTFEAINDVYNMTYQGFTIPIDMTYSIIGTLNDGMLDLEGTCKGSGDINMVFITGTLELEGTVGGSLTKTE